MGVGWGNMFPNLKYISDLENAHKKIECSNTVNNNLNSENVQLSSEVQKLQKKLDNLISTELTKLQEHNETLENDLQMLKQTNLALEEK